MTLTRAAFDLARYCRDAGLDPDRAKSAMYEVWSELKRGERDADKIFDDVWTRQYEAGLVKGRPPRTQAANALPDYERVWIVKDGNNTKYRLQIEGRIIPEITSPQWLEQRKFNTLALDFIGHSYPLLTGKTGWERWRQHTDAGRACAEPEEPVEGTSELDVFMEVLDNFLNDSRRGKQFDDIALGRPWLDDEAENEAEHRYWFRLQDLEKYLRDSGIAILAKLTRRELGARMRELGGGSDTPRIKGKRIRAFWLPGSRFERLDGPIGSPPLKPDPL